MNTKIKNFVEVLFGDIPKTKKAIELKEEILCNLNERYEEAIAEGKGDNQAYTDAIGSLGDVDSMLDELRLDKDLKTQIDHYKKRNATITAVSIMMYILGAAVLIGSNQFGLEEIGLVILLCLAAIATGLLVFCHMSVPYDVSVYLKSSESSIVEEDDWTTRQYQHTQAGRLFSSLMSLYWTVVTVLYFFFSFTTGAWHLTWLIWIVAPVFSKIIRILFEMRYGHD